MRLLVPNTPIKRFEYIAKTYGPRYPGVVLDTFEVLSDVVGIENPAGHFDWAHDWRRVVDSRRWRQFYWLTGQVAVPKPFQYDRAGRTQYGRTEEDYNLVPAQDFLQQAVLFLRDEPGMQRRRDSDVLWPWVAQRLAQKRKEFDRAVKRGGDELAPPYKGAFGETMGRIPWPAFRMVGKYDELISELHHKGTALALWQREENIDLGRWSIEDALEALKDFEYQRKGGMPGGDVVYEWDDGWTVQRLMDEEALEAEGDVMQHCVGGGQYCEPVQDERIHIYSIRDRGGRPHVTIEYLPDLHRFKQVKGKQNRDPIEAYQKRVEDFAKDIGVAHPGEGFSQKEMERVNYWASGAFEDIWDRYRERRYDVSMTELPLWEEVVPTSGFDMDLAIESVFPGTAVQDWEYAELIDEAVEMIGSVLESFWDEKVSQLESDFDDAVEEAASRIEEQKEEDEDWVDVEGIVDEVLDSLEVSGQADKSAMMEEMGNRGYV